MAKRTKKPEAHIETARRRVNEHLATPEQIATLDEVQRRFAALAEELKAAGFDVEVSMRVSIDVPVKK